MDPRRPMLRLTLGLLLAIISAIPIVRAESGLLTRRQTAGTVPLTYMVADADERARWQGLETDNPREPAMPTLRLPGVIVGHGFAGSAKLMLGYAQSLAHAGYAVMLLDFSGHGGNQTALDLASLPDNLDRAYEVLLTQPEVDASRVALLGHSMGSGAVLQAALRNPERYRATVALSPVLADVTPATPRNLQLQAGGWEPRFEANARELLRRAGGPNDDFGAGVARELVMVPAAEHLSILFRPASHDAAIRWLDKALEVEPLAVRAYQDRRVLWWLLQVAGWMLLVSSMAPAAIRRPELDGRRVRAPWHWGALVGSAVAATLLVVALAGSVQLQSLGGIAVGGAVALWMLLAGLGYLLGGFRLPLPPLRSLAWGAGAFVFLWLVLGASADFVWLSWGLVPRRQLLWPLLSLAVMPWFVASEAAQGDSRGVGRGWVWLAQLAVLIGGLLAVASTVPGMYLVWLILPLMPLYFACMALVGSRVNEPWAVGIGNALFFGWLLACAMPLL